MRSVARHAARDGFAAALLLAACAPAPRASGGTPAPGPAVAPPPAMDTVGVPRIRFARGTTSGIVDDTLSPGATRSYVLFASQGQVMLAHAIAWPVAEREHPPADPVVRVFDVASGHELPSPRIEPEIWSGRLPWTGEYLVRVTAAERTLYTLAVQIPRRVEPDPSQPAAIFTGTATSRAPIDFLVHADAGRTLEVVLGGAPTLGLHVYGLDDGVQLAPLPDRKRLYAGRLTITQDYVVSIIPGAERAAYDLRITVR